MEEEERREKANNNIMERAINFNYRFGLRRDETMRKKRSIFLSSFVTSLLVDQQRQALHVEPTVHNSSNRGNIYCTCTSKLVFHFYVSLGNTRTVSEAASPPSVFSRLRRVMLVCVRCLMSLCK